MQARASAVGRRREAVDARRKAAFERRWLWTVGFWTWLLAMHAVGVLYFTSGFLLTRLVLDERSACASSPLDGDEGLLDWHGRGTVGGGCWHPKSFDRAVVVLIDALRYDFTVPVGDGAEFHDAFPFLYETAASSPQAGLPAPVHRRPADRHAAEAQGPDHGHAADLHGHRQQLCRDRHRGGTTSWAS